MEVEPVKGDIFSLDIKKQDAMKKPSLCLMSSYTGYKSSVDD